MPYDARALPLALADFLDVLTACLAVLDPDEHRVLAGQRVRFVFHVGAQHAAERAVKIDPGFGPPDELRRERAARYERVRGVLKAANADLRPDDEARGLYLALRSRWDEPMSCLIDDFGYSRSSPT